ncbi:MAG: hypothetical protein E7549_06640 [Ruminococcaceae bacterium]|nr:hypothetical protein [Oscillospiraceae bacterium]
MNRMIWLIMIPFTLVVGLMLADYAHHISQTTSEEVEEDGCVRNNTNYNAPKTITSTLIISFDCRFSTMDVAEPGTLGNHIYQLQAKLENGAVKGTYQVLDTGEKRLFRDSHVFLNKVQNLVEKYDLAQYNGQSYEVAGLPGDYGVRLEVVYASGERIYTYNNQDNFLPDGAMNELVKLFERGVQVT